MIRKLEPDFIEHIHDVLIGVFLPFDEKISPAEYRNQALIESAAARPFQTAFGVEVWPTLPEKAAALFHSLTCNHCFINGNKRTAVIGLDIFLTINMHLLTMTSEEVYEMAKTTAKANEAGRDIAAVMADLVKRISDSVLDVKTLKDENAKKWLGPDYDRLMEHVDRIMSFNQKLIETESSKNNKHHT